ncbi:hypothetical protein VTH06DRAFT_3954 [Thermothelomyces fergusii]
MTLEKSQPAARGQKKGTSSCCSTEFDYSGWAVWGSYRRSVATIRAAHALVGTTHSATPGHEGTEGFDERKRGSDEWTIDRDTFATWGPP